MEDMLNELSDIKAKRAGITDKQEPRMSISDPTAIKALVTPNFPLKNIPSNLKLLVFSLSLYYWGVPLSRLGQWLGCHFVFQSKNRQLFNHPSHRGSSIANCKFEIRNLHFAIEPAVFV